jgi:hypothetical protein
MRRSTTIIMTTATILALSVLAGCGKKADQTDTNVVEMNASDGTMNDMTVVESATLDQAGGAAAENAAIMGNASNAM